MTAETLLDLTRRAIERGELAVALHLAIEQWRERRAPEVAELVDRIDARIATPSVSGYRDTWIAAEEASTDDVARGALVRGILGRTLDETVALLQIAVAWTDPRVTQVLRVLLEKLPWTGRRSREGLHDIFEVVRRQNDVRLVELARTLPPSWTVGKDTQAFLTREFTAAVAQVKPAAAWPEALEVARLVEPIAKPAVVASVTEDDLLGVIYERPEDDAARAVYADWLMERDDPRGELIALQLRSDKDDASRKREQTLLAKHRKVWIGPLANVLGVTEFRRGFPAVAVAKFRHQRDVDQHGHYPAWATIEELQWVHNQARDDREAWSRALTAEMSGLLRVANPSYEHLVGASRPWRIVYLETFEGDPQRCRTLMTHPLLPALETIKLGWAKPSFFAGVTRCPPHLVFLHTLDGNDREAFVARVEATEARTLTLESTTYIARYSRDADGKLSRLDVEVLKNVERPPGAPTPAHLLGLDTALKRLPFRSLSHVDVTGMIGGKRVSIIDLVPQAKRLQKT